MATPSVCSYRAPLNWNNWPSVDTFSRSTRSSLEIFRLYVELNQLSLKAFSLSLELAFVNFILICTLDNGVMKTPKRREIISLVFTGIWINPLITRFFENNRCMPVFNVTCIGDIFRPSFDMLCKRLKDRLIIKLALFRWSTEYEMTNKW